LYPSALELDNLERFRTEMAWARATSADEPGKLFFAFSQPAKPRRIANNAMIYYMQVWPVEAYARCFSLVHHPPMAPSQPEDGKIGKKFRKRFGRLRSRWNRDDKQETIAPGPSSSTRSEATVVLARTWLNACERNENGRHELCQSQAQYLPTRLLDVQSAKETGKLLLVSSSQKDEMHQYITLSHCWGKYGSEHNPLLRNSNYEERRKVGIAVSSLPQTFRDAIDVTHWFNGKLSLKDIKILTKPEQCDGYG
jgi:hypothetical protein